MKSAIILLAVAASSLYVQALQHDGAREADQVVSALEQLLDANWTNGAPATDFPNTDTPALHAILDKLNAREPLVHKAKVAFTLKGHARQKPEGIAYDPAADAFYISSLSGEPILRVTRNGKASAFVREELPTLGMKVDAKRRLLWVIATTEDNKRSTLSAYDLRSKALVKRIEATPAALNDLTILDDGTLYATDMGGGAVVRLDGDKLVSVAGKLVYPNGITHDGDTLYVADFRGVIRIRRDGSEREEIASSSYIGGIDGLDFVNGALIGIQNAIGNPRVVRIHRDGRVDILETKNPHFAIPTTGAVARGAYWFIANSEMRSVKPRDPVMLRIAL